MLDILGRDLREHNLIKFRKIEGKKTKLVYALCLSDNSIFDGVSNYKLSDDFVVILVDKPFDYEVKLGNDLLGMLGDTSGKLVGNIYQDLNSHSLYLYIGKGKLDLCKGGKLYREIYKCHNETFLKIQRRDFESFMALASSSNYIVSMDEIKYLFRHFLVDNYEKQYVKVFHTSKGLELGGILGRLDLNNCLKNHTNTTLDIELDMDYSYKFIYSQT